MDKTKVSFHKAFVAFSPSIALHVYEDDINLNACDIESYFWNRNNNLYTFCLNKKKSDTPTFI